MNENNNDYNENNETLTEGVLIHYIHTYFFKRVF